MSYAIVDPLDIVRTPGNRSKVDSSKVFVGMENFAPDLIRQSDAGFPVLLKAILNEVGFELSIRGFGPRSLYCWPSKPIEGDCSIAN